MGDVGKGNQYIDRYRLEVGGILSAGAGAVAAAGAATYSAQARALIYAYLVMTPQQFINAVNQVERKPVIVVEAERDEGIINKRKAYFYALSFNGLIAVTKTRQPLPLPSNVKVIKAERIILPQPCLAYLNRVENQG